MRIMHAWKYAAEAAHGALLRRVGEIDIPLLALMSAFFHKMFYKTLHVVQTGSAYRSGTRHRLDFFQGTCPGINGVLNHAICNALAVTYNLVKIHL